MSEQRDPALAGGLQVWPSCTDCKRRAALDLPLSELPGGGYICEDCQRRRDSVATRANQQIAGPTATARTGPRAPAGSSYALLELPLDATPEEITKALNARMQYWLPRQSGDDRIRAIEQLEQLKVAHRRLKSPTARQAYDAELRQQMKAERAAAAERLVRPLDDWPGQQIRSVKQMVAACDQSVAGWHVGERMLLGGGLALWVRFALRDEEMVEVIEEILARDDLTNTRKLNALLYRLDTERPFRCFPNPDRFEAVESSHIISTVEDFVTFADNNWDVAVRHLYGGELTLWLSSHFDVGVHENTLYRDVGEFFDRVCRPFAKSNYEGVGLEALLEFLEPSLAKPSISVIFNDQPDAYSLVGWDGELAHAPITLKVSNTTRGYYAGQIELVRGAKGTEPYPWVDFSWLPLTPPAHTGSAGSSAAHPPAAAQALTQTCTLQGKQTQTFTLHMGHFHALARGKTYQNNIILTRYLRQPTVSTHAATYAIQLRLLRFRAGYRAHLWANGLRGGLPGALLDGLIGCGLTYLLFALGLVLAPHAFWGFFSPEQDFGSPAAWPALFDVFLTLLLRPFFLAIAVLGTALPVLVGGACALTGFFVGLRRGHTAFSRDDDRRAHAAAGQALMFLIWFVSAGLTIWDFTAPYAPHQIAMPFPSAYAPTVLSLEPFALATPAFHPAQTVLVVVFAALSVLLPGITARQVQRAVIAIRMSRYDAVKRRWGALLNPPGKG